MLIIASMVEREARWRKERPLIASVIYNRLREGIPLGIDATVRFVTNNWKRPLRQSELDDPSPYNTRMHAGPAAGPDRQPGPRLDQGRGAAGQHQVPVLRGEAVRQLRRAQVRRAPTREFQRYVSEYNRARDARGGKSPTNC